MEALRSLQVGAVAKCPLAPHNGGASSLSSDGRQLVSARLGAGPEVFGKDLSVQSQKLGRRSTRKNGAVGCKPRRVLAMSVSGAAPAAAAATTALEEARRESLKKEREAKSFTIAETEQVTPQDWYTASVTKVEDVATGVRCITLMAECSREFVKLDQAYRMSGQLVEVKVGEEVTQVAPSSEPFSDEINYTVLLKIRGDIPAGTTKLPAYSLSAKAPLDLHVTETDSPALFNVEEGSEVELGPFGTTGLDLRPILFLSRYPTILLFAQGNGIAVARAILETKDADIGTLNLGFREDVRLYYSAPSPSHLAYKALYSKWEEKKAVKVRTIVESSDGGDWSGYEGSFTNLWDEDDIEYDPLTTGVVVAVESSRREEVKSLLAEAGIPDAQIVFWESPN
ncbi:unnamed protein product [Calypogeia fissa]